MIRELAQHMLSRRVHTEDSNILTDSRIPSSVLSAAWQFAEGLVKCFGGVDAGVETYHHGTFPPAGCRAGKEKSSTLSSNSEEGQWCTERAEPMSPTPSSAVYQSAQIGPAVGCPVHQAFCFRATNARLRVPQSQRVNAKKIERGYFADVDPNGEPATAPLPF